jgi:predicted TIM-barrel fold metal-dependent hydrolase
VPGFVWGWLDPSFTRLGPTHLLDAPRFTPPELRVESAGSGLAGVVHINSTLPLEDPSEESAWLTRLAETDDGGWPLALVGGCELRGPEAPEILRRHSRYRRVRGVRDLSFSQDLDVMAAAPALDAATELGLSVELRTPVRDLGVIAGIATRWPELRVVLGQGGFPSTRTLEDFAAWRAALDPLAAAPNVVCKMSAAGSSADREWTEASIGPWIRECISLFGADRCMFGTNWPLDRLWRPYTGLVAAYRSITSDLTPAARHLLFHGTAERVYGVVLSP